MKIRAQLRLTLDDDTPANTVETFQPSDVFSAFDALEARKLRPIVTMLDPWYNKGVGGVVSDYDDFLDRLLFRACAISKHVYLWGFPEILGPTVRRIPVSHQLTAWLTWYYKNNPSVIRGWRSAQMACLHIAEPNAPMYPQHFLNSVQKQKLADRKLRYMPGPPSVIESPLIIGFVGKSEQTGHPAQKPLAVYDKLIRMVTVEGDLIFDPMCGSGTTGVIAAIRRRRAILNDHDPKYVEIAHDRLKWDLSRLGAQLDAEVNNRESSPPKTVRGGRLPKGPRGAKGPSDVIGRARAGHRAPAPKVEEELDI